MLPVTVRSAEKHRCGRLSPSARRWEAKSVEVFGWFISGAFFCDSASAFGAGFVDLALRKTSLAALMNFIGLTGSPVTRTS